MKKVTDTEKELYALIRQWKINHVMLAGRLGIPVSSFNQKLSPKERGRFTEDELYRLASILSELSSSVDEYVESFA